MERREKKRDRERGARSAGWLRSKDRKYGSEFRVSRMIYRNLNPRGSRLTSSSSSGITPLSGQTKTSRVSIYLFSINAGTTDRTRCSDAGRRWRSVSGKERERMETLPPPPLFSGYSSGIFNYSLGERWWREGRKEGEENNAAGAPSRAASVRGARTLLCVYLVLLIASAWSRLYHYRRSRISVCSLHLCNPSRQCVHRFIGETALPRNPTL